ncbi:MAG: shikimate dehydrogenase [Acidimicrobiaceae bacterium]|nr:shikimate dehydrogenase [Acidimicrobiaceae bacterium]MXZ65024.1 shikimate dehydrogenase [Acidimicrobiaceae bacterium]MYF33333.1 shikimate dehydrogenase [Acidimicrobiaceae bacterium]MYJ85435.1 shikimate dehydrogenase [Acidimicrobiaceae bacterium]
MSGLMPGRRVAAVIGDPARHSRSPAIHNAAFSAAGIDWVFTAFEVPAGKGAAALDAMRVLGLAGMSVTMPLKAEVAAAADTADAEVEILAAANCIVPLGDGRLHAANTDAAGFVAGLRADAGLSPEGLRVVLLGGGGAARAVAWGLAAAGAADVAVINRTGAKAEAAASIADAASRSGRPGRVGAMEDIAAADLVVNATSVGMGSDGSMPCDPTLLRPGQVAVDLVYEPLETAWLDALRQRSVEAHNGLSMLAYQAAAAFEMWTGIDAPVEAMHQAAAAGL